MRFCKAFTAPRNSNFKFLFLSSTNSLFSKTTMVGEIERSSSAALLLSAAAGFAEFEKVQKVAP